MHKKPASDKKTRARNRSARPLYGKSPSRIKDLLSTGPQLRELAARLPQQQSWVQWLRELVPAELAIHIVNAVPKGAELVVFADSAAWCTRLRYALVAMEAQIAARDAAVRSTRVRVALG
jgi:Dna[CI] antecedent DciA-like protein